MRKYESVLILKPNVPETAREEIRKKISEKITALKGKVVSLSVWKDLARFYFPLQTTGAGREKYYEGSYWLLVFELNPPSLGDLKELIRLEENILRNLILRSDE